MKKNNYAILSVFFIVAVLAVMYVTIMPQWVSEKEGPLSEFSSKRALVHIKEIAKLPHFVGSQNHENVALYLEKELQTLGLETKIQEGTTLSDWGNLVKSKNIIARIKGSNSSKALLLLSHYDSAPHSYSLGASDDGSGVATILEGIRTFLHNKTSHKNDIIILFSDAEELGLNGAALFVTQHEWADEVGLALNFEARGTAGPAYMLMEVNKGNAAMVSDFSKANPRFPVSNSLMYSVYKLMPNDTDLTVLREQGKIPGLNFAFIDDHFNYHTAQDDVAHLSEKSVAHDGSYLMPLLTYFSNSDLRTLNSADDEVYFNAPLCFFSYPFSWVLPMAVVALVLFLILVFIGMGKRTLNPIDVGRGFVPLFGALIVSGALAFFGWKTLLSVYSQYGDIQQGFTYNGHTYIAAFVFLSLSICFLFYGKSHTENHTANQMIAPLFLWIVINFLLAIYLPGAGFFIIPVLFSLLMLAWFVVTQKMGKLFNLILSIPTLVILVPFIVMFPIGLGLKILAGSAALTVLVFSLLLPVFGTFSRKWIWAAFFLVCAIGLFVQAHLNADYEPGKAKPNSLAYVYNADSDKAVWATYDKNLDGWTKTYLGEKPGTGALLNTFPLFSKYNREFTFATDAIVRELPEPTIDFVTDSVVGNYRYLNIRITPNRKVNRYDISANENLILYNFKANGAVSIGQKGSKYLRKGKRVLSYYVVNNEPLQLQFSIDKNEKLDMELLESSFDLLHNPAFAMEKRKNWMMPMPFVLTDAIAIRRKIKPTEKIPVFVRVQKDFSLQRAVETDTIQDIELH